MDLREQVGQLLILGFEGAEPTLRLRIALTTLRPGGVILFARNLVAPRQTWELLHECRTVVPTPPFLCVDMEGGTVDRLKDVIAPAPAAAEVFATGKRQLFRKHGRLIGEEVRALGFNVDFAPVVDLGFEASRRVLTSRTVSDDPGKTVAYAKEFLAGLRSAGVLGCGKHFPGLGEAKLDTHHALPQVKKSWKRMWEEDLYPYRALGREFPFVMVAHAAFPAVTKDGLPASLSKKWMGDILRRRIGYRGIVLSDDLEMGGVLAAGSVEHAAVESLRAGADMFLVCRNEQYVWATFHAVLHEAERDRRFRRRVAEAAERVLAFKKRWKEVQHFPHPPQPRLVQRLGKQMRQFSREVARAAR